MTKKDLIEIIARKTKLTKRAAKQVIETFLDEITKALAAGEVVKLSGFGTFKTKIFQPKTIKAIGTNLTKKIASRRMPRYVPGTKIKKMVR